MYTFSQPRIRVKICGITNSADAKKSVLCGADAIGFVFYPPSPRYISPQRALEIVATIPPFITTIGLFVNTEPNDIKAILDLVPLAMLQFHGNETPKFCAQWGKPYIKSFYPQKGKDIVSQIDSYQSACGVLFDSYLTDTPGGTGQTFDWSCIPQIKKPVILAGGLTPKNLAMAIRKVHPYALDVSSSLEKTPGIKDSKKIFSFMEALRNAS